MTVTLPHHLPRQLARLGRGAVEPSRAGDVPADVRGDLSGGPLSRKPVRRVREEVRDGVAVVAFSAAASTGVALMLLVLARVAG
jgi:hypothetical protein